RIRDTGLVREIRSDLMEFSELGTIVPPTSLGQYCDALESLLPSLVSMRGSTEKSVRDSFRSLMQPIEDDLLRLRLSHGAVHTVFGRTIEYLLRRHGPLTTIELHPMIAG